ncbi:MAG: molybdate ABC transporter substrate-binding protein [Acidobacteriota bacterium]
MLRPTSSWRSLPLLMLLALAAPQPGCRGDEDALLVLAAASTIDAMEAAAADFSSIEGVRVEVSFAASSVLARQIAEGAPADLLLSANTAWADYVAERVPIARREVLVTNRITVVVPAGAATNEMSLQELAEDDVDFALIAIADPTSVPAGIYAAEALRRESLWSAFEPRLLPAVDVRAALALVVDGEADAGFVYASDAASSADVRVITRVAPRLHEPIEYPLLLLGSARPGAERLFDFLVSARGRTQFLERGFSEAGR